MRKAADFASTYAPDFCAYVAFEISSGKDFRVETTILKAFDRFLLSENAVDLSEDMALQFAFQPAALSTDQYHKRYRIILKFSEYLNRIYGAPEPFRHLEKTTRSGRHVPYLYSDQEITALLSEAKRLRPEGSLRPETYYLLIGLLYSTGIRISEALNLNIRDINFEDGILTIHNTKFRKSRLIPVHHTTLAALKHYAQLRFACATAGDDSPFFINNRNKRLSYSTVNATFRTLLWASGISPGNGKEARLHDLRHLYAVKRLALWYDNGIDVHEWLPVLSTYMGHAHFEDTAYYISSSAELLAKGAACFMKGGSRID